MGCHMKKIIFALIFLTGTAFADTYYCSSTGQYVNTGDSKDKVRLACGEPQQISRSKQASNVDVVEWIYNTSAAGGGVMPSIGIGRSPAINNTVVVVPVPTSTVTTSIDFRDNLVWRIIVNGQQATSSSCSYSYGGPPVQVGMPQQAVLNLCGNPAVITNKTVTDDQASTQKVEAWQYQPNPYMPVVVFNFTNGQLTSIQQ